MDSILITIRHALGVGKDYDGFDTQIIMHINSALLTLNQVGIGPTDGVIVSGIGQEWSEIMLAEPDIEALKGYVYLKTKLAFDPPTTSFVVNALESQIEQLEWRLLAQVEEPVSEE